MSLILRNVKIDKFLHGIIYGQPLTSIWKLGHISFEIITCGDTVKSYCTMVDMKKLLKSLNINVPILVKRFKRLIFICVVVDGINYESWFEFL